jgi:glyoxylase-like metal-dependent hydrolase (beta-lactamase superfamily II)
VRVHHLNCGTMRAPGLRLVCHVLLLETDDGLVLVDTGFGLEDIADPGRLGPYRHVIRPLLDPAETAARQVESLGFARDDVRHIVVTHFDLDHIGGLADFPHAIVHTTAAEARGAMHDPHGLEKVRFRPRQWAHRPTVVEHEPDGEAWRGFAAARELTEIAPGIVLVALPGHTRGHAAVAVDTGHRWILQAGDAFYHPGSLGSGERVPWLLRAQERLVTFDHRLVRDNHARLTELRERAEPDLTILCAHDPGMFAAARAAAS